MKAAKKCKSVEDMNILFKDAFDNNSYVKKKLVSVEEKTKEIFLQISGGSLILINSKKSLKKS